MEQPQNIQPLIIYKLTSVLSNLNSLLKLISPKFWGERDKDISKNNFIYLNPLIIRDNCMSPTWFG